MCHEILISFKFRYYNKSFGIRTFFSVQWCKSIISCIYVWAIVLNVHKMVGNKTF